MRLEPKTIISQRYEIIDLLGVGGTANVYCAMDLKLDRKVTFKVLKEEYLDEEFISKFSKEARAAARISHINIAGVFDVGNDDNIYYIVMEYIDGYNLKEVIKNKAPFSNDEVLGIAIQVANALEVAHNAGIVHRDIKPQNILVTKDGGVKVTDFGIARVATSHTITTSAMGSAHYFSPEQARGGYVDFKTDIYSLGIMMYEMITGKLPFGGEGVVQLAMQHINDNLPNMKKQNSKISKSLEKIILKATAKNVDNRYATARELNEDLKKALSDETGSFIKESVLDENSETVVIRPEELEEINKRVNMGNTKADLEKTAPIPPLESNVVNRKKPAIENNYKYQPEEESNNKSDKKVVIGAVLTALAIIVVITSVLLFNLFGTDIEAPNFEGKTLAEATKIAEDEGIILEEEKKEFSDTIKEGAIISQDIAEGTKLEEGSTIKVIVSLGAGSIELDDYTGLDIAEVYEKVKGLSIKFDEEYVFDEDAEVGIVVRQSPTAGSVVTPEDTVKLYVSRGKEDELVLVPNLIGVQEEEAEELLISENLVLGNVTKTASSSVPAGQVISQSINFGNEIDKGTAISIVVSTGEPETQTTTEATTEEITKEPVIEETTDSIPETTTEESTTGAIKTDTLIISPVVPQDATGVQVRVVQVIDGQSSVVYSSSHSAADFPLEIGVSGNKPTQYELYINDKLIGTETKQFN